MGKLPTFLTDAVEMVSPIAFIWIGKIRHNLSCAYYRINDKIEYAVIRCLSRDAPMYSSLFTFNETY